MNIKETIATINQMQADGIIERYAIGGAVGATFYLEPVATLDVDIFVTFKSEARSALLNPQPIFDYLKARGGTMRGEYIVISGWPVQFLPPTGPLVEEALRDAVTKDVEGTPALVFTAEHLAASPCRPAGPRTRPASSSSSKPARWMPRDCRPSSPGMDCRTPGTVLRNNSSATHHEF